LLAGLQGPEAVAKLVDRRLAALERARAMVAWEKERDLAEDLDATVDMILGELLPLSAVRALECLLRFVDTHGRVFDRIDDSRGRIQSVYWRAAEAVPEVADALAPDDAARLPGRLLASLDRDTHRLAHSMSIAVAGKLPPAVLTVWDGQLAAREADDDVLEIRQAIADARGDVDGFLALEERRSGWRRDPLKAAERLLAAGRLEEALSWCQRERKGGLAFAMAADPAADPADDHGYRYYDLGRVRLEVRIREAMKDRPAAQALRWAAFEATFDADLLRDYLRKLDDFIEYEERERAFDLAAAAAGPFLYRALELFLAWPDFERAARLAVDRHAEWNGRNYDVLGPAAATLEFEFPLAATVLYRALLNDILARGKSPAYGHGARYLAKLGDLAALIPADAVADLEDHTAYCQGLKKTHGRKSGFWSLVEGGGRG